MHGWVAEGHAQQGHGAAGVCDAQRACCSLRRPPDAARPTGALRTPTSAVHPRSGDATFLDHSPLGPCAFAQARARRRGRPRFAPLVGRARRARAARPPPRPAPWRSRLYLTGGHASAQIAPCMHARTPSRAARAPRPRAVRPPGLEGGGRGPSRPRAATAARGCHDWRGAQVAGAAA